MANFEVNNVDQSYSNLIELCNWRDLTRVAVEHCDTNNSIHITYSEVDEARNAIREFLITIQPSQFIGISADIPSFCTPTLMLGIISSGHAFVCLSKDSQLLQDALNVQYIFSKKHDISNELEMIKIITHQQELVLLKLSITCSVTAVYVDSNYRSTNCNFAYAVTTSGSTGKPVTVKVTHACIIPNIVELAEKLKLSSSDKIAQLTPLTFDPSVVEIFLSFFTGATLFTLSEKIKNNPHELLMSLHEQHVTFLSTTPSLLLHRWLLSDVQKTILGRDSRLENLFLGGELFPTPELLRKIKHPENNTRIFNIYGITQVSCWASINPVGPNLTINPEALGDVLTDTIFQVRNNENKVIHEGDGVLYIGSYTRICELDGEKLYNLELPVFRNTGDVVTINKNGKLNFKGRQDSCIKRFGIKIYINDLKYHIEKLNFIKDSSVIWLNESSRLHVFFTTFEGFYTDKNKLINEAWVYVKKLPAILHPDGIHLLTDFVMTQHGKICKKSLKKLCSISKSDNIEIHLKRIWQNRLPAIIDDNQRGFLDAGGTSIMALEISQELTDEMKNNFPDLIGMLLENKTLEMCFEYIAQCCEKSNIHNESSSVHIQQLNSPTSRKIDNCKDNICSWQKCKGKTIISRATSPIDTYNILSTCIHVENLYNLNKCVDASPTLFGYTNENIFATVGSHSGIICTVDLQTTVTWQVQLPDRIEASILVCDNFKAIIGCYDGFIYCIHLKSGVIFWKFHTGNMVKCLAVMCSANENLFFGSYDRFLYCITLESGELVWKREASSIRATPLVHEKSYSVIFALLDGYCISVHQINGKIRWKYKLANPIFSSPILSTNNSTVIVSDVNGNFAGLKVDCGIKLWDFSISAYVFSDLIVYKELESNFECLIFSSKDGHVYTYQLDEKQPKLKYKIDCYGSIVATPWVTDVIIVVAREDGNVMIFDMKNQTLLSNMKLAGHCFSSPIVHQDFIVIGCRDNNLCILTLK